MTLKAHQLSDAAHAAPLVLVVEDEVVIRMLTVEMLQEAGFRVIEACDADEAMAVLDSNLACDVIFTDVNMPGSIDGLGLADHVKRSYPGVPVILTSGGVPPHVLSQFGPAAVVAKPYSESELTAAIRRALSARDD